jgi:hypothetical protein
VLAQASRGVLNLGEIAHIVGESRVGAGSDIKPPNIILSEC